MPCTSISNIWMSFRLGSCVSIASFGEEEGESSEVISEASARACLCSGELQESQESQELRSSCFFFLDNMGCVAFHIF